MKICICCGNEMDYGAERPISFSNPNVCVPCVTGIDLNFESDPTDRSSNAFPTGRWNTTATAPRAEQDGAGLQSSHNRQIIGK